MSLSSSIPVQQAPIYEQQNQLSDEREALLQQSLTALHGEFAGLLQEISLVEREILSAGQAMGALYRPASRGNSSCDSFCMPQMESSNLAPLSLATPRSLHLPSERPPIAIPTPPRLPSTPPEKSPSQPPAQPPTSRRSEVHRKRPSSRARETSASRGARTRPPTTRTPTSSVVLEAENSALRYQLHRERQQRLNKPAGRQPYPEDVIKARAFWQMEPSLSKPTEHKRATMPHHFGYQI